MILHIFNPEHDMALAANDPFWTAPHAGRQMRADLGWIPALWASDNDLVLVDNKEKAEFSSKKISHSNPNVYYVELKDITSNSNLAASINKIMPWGWDVNIRAQLLRSGINECCVPDNEHMAAIRELSGRATAARLLSSLCITSRLLHGEAIACNTFGDVVARITDYSQAVLKTPWSCSGRGVRYVRDIDKNTERWICKTLEKQGYIMVEPYYDKVKDFGMEFTSFADGTVRYEGLSLFRTLNGTYVGSVLATEDEKRSMLTKYIPKDLLDSICRYICDWMSREINGQYVGPFGVDMMIIKTHSGLKVNPCVEINLRRTMGHVALSLSPTTREQQCLMNIGYDGNSYHMRIINDHELLC